MTRTLGGGYSKDSWTVYYREREVEGAAAGSFVSLGGGYGKDAWTVFFQGRKVGGASASSFENIGKGYGKDAWSVYYRGERSTARLRPRLKSLRSGGDGTTQRPGKGPEANFSPAATICGRGKSL